MLIGFRNFCRCFSPFFGRRFSRLPSRIGLGVFLSIPALQAAPLPVESYGALPTVFAAAISPDGTKVAIARNHPDGAQVAYVMDLASGKLVRAVTIRTVARESEQPLMRGIGFADNQRLAYLMHATFSQMRGLPAEAMAPGRDRIDYWHTGILDIDSGKSVLVSRKERLDWGIPFIELITPVDGDPRIGRMAIPSTPYKDGIYNVYDVSLERGTTRLHTRGRANTRDWAFGPGGVPVARIDVDDRKNQWSLYAIDGKNETLVTTGASETGYGNFVGVTEDGGYAFLAEPEGGDRDVLYTLRQGQPDRQVLFEHPTHDVDSVTIDIWRNTVIGTGVTVDFTEQHFLDPQMAAVHKALSTKIPDALIGIGSWSADRKKFIAYIEVGGDAGGYYLFEPGQGDTLKLLAMRYPEVKGDALGDRLGITYPARDGTRIPAYITRPSGYEKGQLPTVLLVHGGPVSRDTLAYDWWASFLASRGYLVVQPNYRGSGGYGKQWEEAGHRQWGKLMQDDVEDAVHALVRAGMADPKRICIVGASYGGYATLVGATRTPELFRCAASFAGVSDLPYMLKLTRLQSGSDGAALDWWRMLIGDPEKDRESLEAASPAMQAHRATAPILLMHGANDTVVPISQSERMDDALRRAGKPVEFIRFPSEDHWLSDGVTRIAMLRELERFLAAHIGGASAQ